jgi:hypothetical protein
MSALAATQDRDRFAPSGGRRRCAHSFPAVLRDHGTGERRVPSPWKGEGVRGLATEMSLNVECRIE